MRRGTNITHVGLATLDLRLHAPGAKDHGKKQGEKSDRLPCGCERRSGEQTSERGDEIGG